MGLALLVGEAARRREDARLLLVGLAFVTSAGFFGLHALATPGVLLEGANAGFVVATPVGLLVASVFAVLSSLEWPPERARALLRRQGALRAGVLLALVAWAAASLAELGPLARPLSEEVATPSLVALASAGGVLYGVAALRYLDLYRRRGAAVLLAVAVAFALLAETMIVAAFARSWHLSWWEWHVLLLASFALVAWSARSEWRVEGTSGEIFSGLYLDETRGRREDLSILFADLEGFTSYAERAGAAEVKRMLDTYFGAAAPIVAAHDGRIDKTIGDAIMVVFRDGDHALRATRAALAFQRRMDELAAANAGWRRFRAAVNSGDALVGLVDAPGARRFTVTGDTVNVAARLEGKARAGEVVVGAETRRRLPRTTDFEPLGTLDVKGKSAPVEAFVVRALPDEAPR